MTGNIVDYQINKVFADLAGINTALDLYRQKTGAYPTDVQGLDAMTGVTILRISKDPWGSSYAYKLKSPKMRPFVYSIGLDQIDAGGAGDDVTYRDKEYRCKDYGVNCGPDPLQIAALLVAALGALSLLVGLVRGIVWSMRQLNSSGS